jgi:hypothetical protein
MTLVLTHSYFRLQRHSNQSRANFVITSSLISSLALIFFLLEMAQKYADMQLAKLLMCCQNPPVSHLGNAVLYLQYLFELNKVRCNIFGGLGDVSKKNLPDT